ncbi:MATE family efflux transporter [Siminovitchia fordii]|uniref:Probable multidrug resistance protein NorM n=1 Tax=Siminovitchia fordii TaxID=254759 RepID=A0ABQ4K5Y5_9BACI|nr:MATE family efflux transporter [Siminovitchia fordii]GIN21147.1 putative multidrug resistance protein NorM [Siminovitchia fordii]
MKQTFTTKEKLKQLNIILVPILITQIAMFSMTFFDIMMTGNYSPSHLAGVAIGSSLWFPVFTGLSGILLSVTPIIAQLIGAKRHKDVPSSVIQGIYASFILAAVILTIGFFILEPILNRMNLEEEVRHVAKHYIISLAFGIIPVFAYNVLRSFIDALGKTRVTMFITLASLPLNILFNYLLIFGKLGLPKLGGIGAGVASTLTYWIITASAAWIIHTKKPFADYGIFLNVQRASINKLKEIFILGIPMGLSIFVETSIFAAVTLFMSEFGTVVIAAHQAALNFSSLLYMVPMSISMALTILVGYEFGAKRFHDARIYSFLGIFQAVIVSSITGVFLLFYRFQIAGLYSESPEVISWAAQFMLYAVFFQLSDAVQAPIQGALRGYKDVNVTFIMALISFWVIGLPFGLLLSKFTDFGPFSYWFGLIIGLAAGAATLSFRLLHIQKINIKKNEQASLRHKNAPF